MNPILQTGFEHHQAGRLQQAEAAYRQVLVADPNQVDALYLLGSLAAQVQRPDAAAELLSKVVSLQPSHSDALSNLGKALNDLARYPEAANACIRAIRLNPNYPGTYNNLGIAFNALRKYSEAIAAFSNAIRLRPDYAEAYYNVGHSFKDQQKFYEAEAAFSKSIQLKPDYYQAHNNLGNVLMEQGKLPQAMTAYESAVRHRPDHIDARRNLSLIQLLLGDFEHGWAGYEGDSSRVEWAVHQAISQPKWDGSALRGKTILLHTEQGFGDTIQFIRYATLLAEQGGSVVIECQPELKELLQHSYPHMKVIARGEPRPPFDVHTLIMTLPLLFQTRLNSIPSAVPYLSADPRRVAEWMLKVNDQASGSTTLKVGLVWGGSTTHPNNRNRSITLRTFIPLNKVPGVQFHSLQLGDPAKQLAETSELAMTDLTGEITSFTDTAALVAQMDLVIAVDTAVAHLAGAMGKPVWVLLPWIPDWRWLLDRTDNPWYPTMRLFRQTAAKDWAPVIRDVARALESLVSSK